MICYFIYSGLDWPGISTAFITCCFISLENTGATMRRGWLRLIGCCLGGLLGFLAIIFLIPHMESLTSLVLLTAVGTAFAGWIATGSDRISYAGLQTAFAFYLCIFQGFAPETNFTTIRDRIVGIILGITVSSIVFHYLWPEHAIDGLRTTLARLLRNLSRMLLVPGITPPSEAEKTATDKLRRDITKDLDNTLRLSELMMFENAKAVCSNGLSASNLERLALQTQALCQMATVLLGNTKLQEWEQLEHPVQQAETILRAGATRRLEQVAAFVECTQALGSSDLEPAFATWSQAVAPVTGNDRPRLVRRVIEHIQRLV